MKLISWDIGMENLMNCLMENKIPTKWIKIDILEEIRPKKHQCCGVLKNKLLCQKNASVYHIINDERIYYCKTHGKDMIKIPKHELCHSFNKNGKVCKSKAMFYTDDNKYYCNKHNISTETKKYITPDNVSFYEMSRFLYDKLDKLGDEILKVDKVLIENQPVYKNPVMKSIQMLLYGYYLMKENEYKYEIVLINATQKMKVYDGPKIECNIKDVHARNKYLSIEMFRYIYRDNKELLEEFESDDKKDDKADVVLQGLYHIKNTKV